MKLQKVLLSLAAVTSLVAFGCGQKQESLDISPHTGEYEYADQGKAQVEKKDLDTVTDYFIQPDHLNARTTPAINDSNVAGSLTKNDIIHVVDTLTADTDFIQIQVVKSDTISQKAGQALYISYKYIGKTKAEGVVQSEQSKYIIIQNVATERMRVYERCTATPDCPHKMIFQTRIVVGRKTAGETDEHQFLTWLGYSKIVEWRKFHEDAAGHYPAWYKESYPPPPAPGADMFDWFKTKYLPPTKEAHMRGGFGWFTAFTAPNTNEQWLHGTLGWGADHDDYISVTRSKFVNMFKDPRSSGCTRTDNEAIAYLRHIIPVGTPLIRVYALEAYRDKTLSSYQDQKNPIPWNYIMTKPGGQKNGPEADRDFVLKSGLPESEWLEQGTYMVNRYPKAMGYKWVLTNIGRSTRETGSVYNLSKKEFHGVFVVDEGRFVNYDHPAGLRVGGYPGAAVPQFVQSTDPNYTLANPDDN